MARPLLSITLALAAASSGLAETYFMDATTGDDKGAGTSAQAAWKSLEKFNATAFKPGDKILFKSGQRWTGQLKPKGSGSTSARITIGRHGEGGLPSIDGEGGPLDTLRIEDVEYWTVNDLAVTNKGSTTAADRTGVRIYAEKLSTMRGITLSGLHVHDVNGDLRKSHEGHGILFETNRRSGSTFDGILIENCRLERTDRNGICQRSQGKNRSKNVIIRGNVLEDIGGDGIKLWGTNGGLIERNIVRNARARCQDHAAGIWPFASDNTIIQYNEVSGTKGTTDGQGFDADYLCKGTIIQYNHSHDNEGGFLLVCSPGNSYNTGTIIRHNVSVNDGIESGRVIQIGGNPDNTLFHDNTIVIGSHQKVPLLSFNGWDGGNASNTRFENNRIIVASGGEATYKFDKSKGNQFKDNLFLGNHKGLPVDVVVTPLPDGTTVPTVPATFPNQPE